MRICFVCSEYPPGAHGGIGTMTRLLARGFVARGHQVRVVGIYPRTSDLPLGSYDDDGIRVWRLRETAVPKIGWMLSRVKLYRQVRAWSRRGEIDLVEVPDYQGWAARWPSLSVPVIVRLNGSSTYNSTQTGGRVSRQVPQNEAFFAGCLERFRQGAR